MAKSKTFAEAMEKVPEKVFAEAKKVQAGGTFELPDIMDGKYKAKWSGGECGIGGKGKIEGIPYVRINFVVFDNGQYEGVKLEKFHTLKDMTKDLARVVKTFKGLGYEFEESFKAKDLEKLVASANDDPPSCMLTVKNGEYTDGEGNERKKIEVYTDRPLAEDELQPVKKAPAAKAKKK